MPEDVLPVDVPVGAGSIICFSNPGNRGYPYQPPLVQNFYLSAATAIEIQSGTLYSYDNGTVGLHINRDPADSSKLAVYLHYGSFFHSFSFTFTATTSGASETWAAGSATFTVYGIVIGADRPYLPVTMYDWPVGMDADNALVAATQCQLGDMAITYVQDAQGNGIDRATIQLYLNQIRDPDTSIFEKIQMVGELKTVGRFNIGVSSSSTNDPGATFEAGSMVENLVVNIYDGGGHGNAGVGYGDLMTAIPSSSVTDSTIYVTYFDKDYSDTGIVKYIFGAFELQDGKYSRSVETTYEGGTGGEGFDFEFEKTTVWTLKGRHYVWVMSQQEGKLYAPYDNPSQMSGSKPVFGSIATAAVFGVGLPVTFSDVPPRTGWSTTIFVTNNPVLSIDGVGFVEQIGVHSAFTVYQVRPEYTPQYDGWQRQQEFQHTDGKIVIQLNGTWYTGLNGTITVSENDGVYTVTGGTALASPIVRTIDYIAIPYAPTKHNDIAMKVGDFVQSIHNNDQTRVIESDGFSGGYWSRYPLRRLNSVNYRKSGSFDASFTVTLDSGSISINDTDIDYIYSDNHEYHSHSKSQSTRKTVGVTECTLAGQQIDFNCAQISSNGYYGDNCCILNRLWAYNNIPGTYTYRRESDDSFVEDQDYTTQEFDSTHTETSYYSRSWDSSDVTTLRGGTHSQPVKTGTAFGWINFADGRSPSDAHRELLASVSLNVSGNISNIPIDTRHLKTHDEVIVQRSSGEPVPHTPVHVIDDDTTTQSTDFASFGDSFCTIAKPMDVNDVHELGHITSRKTVSLSASFDWSVWCYSFDGSSLHVVPYREISEPVVGGDQLSIQYEEYKEGSTVVMAHCTYYYHSSYGGETDPSSYTEIIEQDEKFGSAAETLFNTVKAKYDAVKSSGVTDAPTKPANGSLTITSNISYSESENIQNGQVSFD